MEMVSQFCLVSGSRNKVQGQPGLVSSGVCGDSQGFFLFCLLKGTEAAG